MKKLDEDSINGEILQCLRSNPKGMTVTEISRKIGLNRNSTAKYLDVLKVNGQIDLRRMGRAKVYYVSHRVPIRALLDFSTDYILVLDSRTKIIEVNDNLQKMFKVKKEMLLDVPLQSSNLPIFNNKDSMEKIRNAIKGKDSTFEMKIALDAGDRYFKGKLIPSALGDGTNGVTIIMENITEQKLSQQKLKRSEERYKELIQNQGEGLGITDVEDNFTFANPAAERLLEVESGDLVGRSVMEFLPAGERKKVFLQNERRKKGKKDTYQVKMLTGTGNRKDVLLTATPRYDLEGRYIGSLGVFRDITLMKENQRKIRESESRFRSLFESSSDGILILKDRMIVECNQSAVRLFGCSTKEEIVGRNPATLSPELQEDGTTSEQAVVNKFREVDLKGFVNFSWKHRKISGEIFLADVRLHKIELESEVFFQATLRDITEMVRTQNEVVEKQKRLDNILSSLHGSFIGLIDRDLSFREFWGTRELDELYDIEYSELKGMSILDFTPDEMKEDIKKGIEGIFENGEAFRTEVNAVLPAGRFWQDWSFSAFKDPQGRTEFVIQFGRDTHDKNRMVEALMRVGKRYRLLDSNVNDVIWMTDKELNYTYVSSSVKNLLGYENKEILKKSIHDTVPVEYHQTLDRTLRERLDFLKDEVKDCPSPATIEIPLIRKDGTSIWCEISLSILNDDDGTPEGIMGVTRNIEERKLADREIKEREQMMENILSSLYSSFIGLIGKDYRYENFWGSRELDERYGIRSSDLKGMSSLDFAPPDHRGDMKAIIDGVLRTGNPYQLEVSSEVPKGRTWQLMSFSPFKDERGRVTHVVQYGSDTTEKNLAMKKLKDAQKKYKLLDDFASDVIWITDSDLNYTYISSSSNAMTGYTPDELIGTSLLGRIEKGSLDRIMNAYGNDMENFQQGRSIDRRSFKMEMELKHKNGRKVWAEINTTVLTDDENKPVGMMGVTRDITDKKRNLREIELKDRILDSIAMIASSMLQYGNWKEKVSAGLRLLGKATNVSRAFIFRNGWDGEDRTTTQIMEWSDEGIESQEDNPDLVEFHYRDGFARWEDELSSGIAIHGNVEDFPDSERSVLKNQGIISLVVVPIIINDEWWGFIGFDECNRKRHWYGEEIKALKVAGSMLGTIISGHRIFSNPRR